MEREEEGEGVPQRERAVPFCGRRVGEGSVSCVVGEERPSQRSMHAPASCSASSLTLSAEFVGLVPLPLSPTS